MTGPEIAYFSMEIAVDARRDFTQHVPGLSGARDHQRNTRRHPVVSFVPRTVIRLIEQYVANAYGAGAMLTPNLP
jgi:hypothetical protein